MTRWLAALAAATLLVACGKYGPPERSAPKVDEPATEAPLEEEEETQ